jgi:hypothetical protein
MRIVRVGVLLIAPLLMAPGSPAHRVSRVGIILAAEPSSCLEGTHVLQDPCTGTAVRLASGQVNLNLFLGLHVKVGGRAGGTECEIIEVRSIRLVPQKCAGPEP